MRRSQKKFAQLSQNTKSERVQSRPRIQIRQKSRGERIRDKNIVYPESSEEKIVFITNKYGNGFRKRIWINIAFLRTQGWRKCWGRSIECATCSGRNSMMSWRKNLYRNWKSLSMQASFWQFCSLLPTHLQSIFKKRQALMLAIIQSYLQSLQFQSKPLLSASPKGKRCTLTQLWFQPFNRNSYNQTIRSKSIIRIKLVSSGLAIPNACGSQSPFDNFFPNISLCMETMPSYNNQLPNKRPARMATTTHFKDGNVYTFQVPQNSANYQIRVALTPKGLWVCIEESYMQWKLTISEQLAMQTIAKATAGQQTLTFKQFVNAMGSALRKEGDRWSVGIMTPIELEILRGGNANKQSNNNKLYLILTEKQKKFHCPFTFPLNDLCEKEKLTEAIKSMKDQLDELRTNNDKSMSSFSIMNQTNSISEQLRLENEELKKRIKMYEDSLTLKRGAVEIDNILRQKNDLEIRAETKKRQEARQIARLKNVHNLLERDINELKNEVDLINRELMLLEDNMGNPAKLKSHAMRVLKSYEVELRNSKKVLMKQTKQIETVKRNIVNSKNNERKHLAKIKQIQQEIDQAKKKANVKEISNRLHSPGNSRQGSSAAGSLKAPSVASNSSDGKGPRSVGNNYNRAPRGNNLVRQNLLKKTSDIRNQRSLSGSGDKNLLLKTTPNIKTPAPPRKTDYKPPVRPVVSSHLNNQANRTNSIQNRTQNSGGYRRQTDSASLKSTSTDMKKKQFSPADRERQKQAMERLTGGTKSRSNQKPPVNTNSEKKLAPAKNNNSATKPAFGMAKKDNAKDILNKMKEVRAQYNNRSRNSAAKQKGIAAKVAQLTGQK